MYTNDLRDSDMRNKTRFTNIEIFIKNFLICFGLALWFSLMFWTQQIGLKRTLIFILPNPAVLDTILAHTVVLGFLAFVIFSIFKHGAPDDKPNPLHIIKGRIKIYLCLSLMLILCITANVYALFIREHSIVHDLKKDKDFIVLGYIGDKVVAKDQDDILILKKDNVIVVINKDKINKSN